MPGYVGTSLAKLVQLFRKTGAFELNGRSDDGEEVVMGHFVRGETYDLEVIGKETSSFLDTG